MSNAKHILVTGGKGRLGGALAATGCTALGRSELDLTDVSSVESALSQHTPKLVINCAAYTKVDQAEQEPELAYAINRDGAGNLAEVCAKADIPLIHISTDCVFGDGDPARPKTEEDNANPLSVYGKSKFEGEELVRRSAARTVIVRVSWLFDQSPDSYIGRILNFASLNDDLKIVEDAYGRLTPLHDVPPVLLSLADRMIDGMPVPSILHIGPQEPVSRFEWAEAIFESSKQLEGPVPNITPCPASDFSEPARRPRGLILDVATGNALLGLMPSWRTASHAAVAQNLK